MPSAAPRFCPRCRSPHPAGSACPVLAAERLAAADRMRPNARARGYDSAWEKARAAYLRQHPNCVVCGRKAEEVDHIVPVGAGGAMWDEANWQSLCQRHHRAETMIEINSRRVPRHATP